MFTYRYNGVDYDSTPLIITLPVGATMVEVCIPITVDDADEDIEMFYLSLVLETFTPRNVALGPNSFVNAFIVDLENCNFYFEIFL